MTQTQNGSRDSPPAPVPAKPAPKPRETSSFVTAAKRLAPHVGITMTSTGRAWLIENDRGPWPTPLNSARVLGRLIMFAVADHGMTYRQVAGVCRLRCNVTPERLMVGRGAGWWTREIARTLAAANGKRP